MSGEPWPNYVRLEWDADDEEIRCPPTTHLVAIVDDLTDMLDFNSEDIDSMDDDAGDEEEPLPTGRWTATSSYDIYMVDTPKEGNGDEIAEDDPSKKQPKCQRQWRHSKSRQSKSGDTGIGDNNTPDSAEDNNNPLQQDLEQENEGASSPERAADGEEEDDNYIPPPKTRQASATMNSPSQMIPSNKSASSAGLWPRQIALRKSSSSFKLIRIC